VALITITLVVPVVVLVVAQMWVGVSVWSPSKIVGTIDVGVVVLKSVNITWFVVTVTPDSVVAPFVLKDWDSLSL